MAVTPDQLMAGAGLLNAFASSQASQAAAIQQQTGFMLQARDALAVADVRAGMSEQYAMIQAGRTLKKAEIEATNYQMAGNQLLRNMRRTNAALRARAAANGVALGSGSIADVQQENVDATMRDVAVADMNAFAARVFGFEDASAMIESTQIQNVLNRYTAGRQAGQLDMAGSAARQQGGLLANAQLTQGLLSFAKTYKGDEKPKRVA